MPNYPTSYHKKPRGAPRRYVVTYEEDCRDGKVMTFSVIANLASEATAKTIDFIKSENLHDSYFGYTLYPVLSEEDAEYEIY